MNTHNCIFVTKTTPYRVVIGLESELVDMNAYEILRLRIYYFELFFTQIIMKSSYL